MAGKPILDFPQLLDEIKDDQRIWDLFKNGITATLNQVDSDNGTAQAKKFGIQSFEDGAFIAAAIRPSFNSWREQFLARKRYTTGSRQLDEVLKQTHSYILFQENLMQYFDWLGVTPAESIGLIKKISKKKIKPEDFENLEGRLRKNWIEKTGSVLNFKETWEMIQSCISYGFCSSHAAATSGDMCYGAYLKVHYPCQYYCVALNYYRGDAVRTRRLTDELKYFGITLSDIKFRKSVADYSVDIENRVLYKGLASIKYLNEECASSLYALRDETYLSFVDLLAKIAEMRIDSRQLGILIDLNFFSEFGTIGYLQKCNEIFTKYYGKKQIRKDKAFEEKLDFDLIRKYAQKETPKMFTGLDSLGFIRELVKDLPQTEPTLRQIIGYQLDHLGYLDIVDKKYKGICVVTGIDTKHSPKLTLYPLANGNSFEVKIPKKVFTMHPLFEKDIIHVFPDGCTHKYKNVFSDGKWVKDTTQKEWWVDRYTVMSDEEIPCD